MAIKARWAIAGLAAAVVLWILAGIAFRTGAGAQGEEFSINIQPYMNLTEPSLAAFFDSEERTYGGTGAAVRAELTMAKLSVSCRDASYTLMGLEGILLGGGLFCPAADIAAAKQMVADIETALDALPDWQKTADRALDPRRAHEWGTSVEEAFAALASDSDVFAPILRVPLSDWEHESGAKLFLNAARYRKSGSNLPYVDVEFTFPQDCLSRFLIYTRVTEEDPDWQKPENAEVISHFGNRVYALIPTEERSRLTMDYIRNTCRLG